MCHAICTLYMSYGLISPRWNNIVNTSITSKPRWRARFGWTIMKYAFCVCVCYWPQVCEVCPKYEVVMLQPRTFTTPYLGYITYCYISYWLNPPHHIFLPSDVCQGYVSHSWPSTQSIDVYPNGIIWPQYTFYVTTSQSGGEGKVNT